MADLRVPDLNRVLIAGRLTRDPDLRYTTSGTPYCRIGIACTRYYKAKDGSRAEETVFVDVAVWGPSAEWVGERLRKGRPVIVEGRLRSDSWEDKESGQKRSKIEINAQRVMPLDWDEASRGSAETQRSAPPVAAAAPAAAPAPAARPQPRVIEEPIPEDDIPF
ncbi:MAG: single-stranded DNA-binding protein [Candidatus Hydrogenedentes bacterium]|nr:single-stranded DNA-binding protein [Candidatus Hydrogenedentota bacterium]MBI3118423.1 single-stranded DNA-binding protein [Candidatus Hydrogenedentota bacterium]